MWSLRRLPQEVLVIFSQRELDVDSGEQGEHVRLKNSDEDFEQREHEAKGEGSDAEQLEERGRLEQEPRGRAEAEHEQQVAGNHVHEESECEGDRTQDENREELNRRHDDVNRPRHTGREERVLEERTGVLAQTGVDEGHIGDDGHNNWQTDERGTSNVHAGDDAGDVHREGREEDGGQQRKKAASVFLTEEVFGDVDAHNIECHLSEGLPATGNQLHATRTEPEQHDQQRGHDQTNEDNAVDLERRSLEEEKRREEFVDGRANESTIAAFSKQSYSVL